MPLVPRRRRSRRAAILLSVATIGGLTVAAAVDRGAEASKIDIVTSTFRGSDGTIAWAKNHLVRSSTSSTAAKLPDTGLGGVGNKTVTAPRPPGLPHEYLVVWAGDANASDTTGASAKALAPAVNPVRLTEIDAEDDLPGQDFLAVIDADKTSAEYGKVVNTVTVGPIVSNEPHHMQYLHHKGDRIFAGGLYTDVTYVFDVNALPTVSIVGINLPTDTPCGSIPDAYWTLKDGTAYGTYMGGPDVPGPCTYTNGDVRVGNGFGGSPGSIVHLDRDGKTLSETPAALPTGEDSTRCVNIPALVNATCANPHGVQAREDLNILIASDYAEPRNIVLDPVKPPSAQIFRDTVRTFDITDRNDPKLKAVSIMPDGPRKERNPGHEEPRGIMEVTVTQKPGHKGAFASSMCGGVIYYTPDITAVQPIWHEVFDDTTAAGRVNPQVTEGGGCDGGGWVQTSGDDNYLYHVVIGRSPGALDPYDTGSAKMLYVLDIKKLVAAGTGLTCAVDQINEAYTGGKEADCPALTDVLTFQDNTSGGPHWGTPDNYKRLSSGQFQETTDYKRLAVSNYFVARTGVDGNHKVCMVDVKPGGKVSLDTTFIDENEGTPCVDFNRSVWPHGKTGNAKPHSELFVVADDAVVPGVVGS